MADWHDLPWTLKGDKGEDGGTTPHAARHGTDGSDPLTPAAIGAQPVAVPLTQIAGLTPTDGDVLRRVASGWAASPLSKGLVGLGSVDNTSDADKPVSGPTANALAGKADTGAVADALATKADESHSHSASAVTSGTFGIARIPVADAGQSSTTAVPRADDPRLSDARDPNEHTHPATDVTAGHQFSCAGPGSSNQAVAANAGGLVAAWPTNLQTTSLVTKAVRGAGHQFTLNRTALWSISWSVLFNNTASDTKRTLLQHENGPAGAPAFLGGGTGTPGGAGRGQTPSGGFVQTRLPSGMTFWIMPYAINGDALVANTGFLSINLVAA